MNGSPETPAGSGEVTPLRPSKAGRIVTVASGKGGVGKTWFSISLAHAMAFRAQKVLLFDGDLGLANVDVQLGLSPAKDLASVIAGKARLAQALTRYDGRDRADGGQSVGFDVLAGQSGSGTLSNLSRGDLMGLVHGLTHLARSYDVVIADMAAGIDQAVTTFAGAGHTIIVVLTDEPTSLTDAYAFIKLMVMRDPSTDIRVLVNMAASVPEARRTYATLAKACRSFLKTEPAYLGTIPRDDKVKLAIRQQASLLARYPQSAAAREITGIADKLVNEPAPGARAAG